MNQVSLTSTRLMSSHSFSLAPETSRSKEFAGVVQAWKNVWGAYKHTLKRLKFDLFFFLFQNDWLHHSLVSIFIYTTTIHHGLHNVPRGRWCTRPKMKAKRRSRRNSERCEKTIHVDEWTWIDFHLKKGTQLNSDRTHSEPQSLSVVPHIMHSPTTLDDATTNSGTKSNSPLTPHTNRDVPRPTRWSWDRALRYRRFTHVIGNIKQNIFWHEH